jgi:1-acyl-sn-glycerol-3-phosphate acyltransferase
VSREKGGFWVGLTAVVFYPITWAVARWRVEGMDRLPESGPVLVVANHVSYLDPVYSAVFVHRARRVPRFLAKDSLWRIPIFGWIMAGSGQIAVYRDSADAQNSLRDGIQALQDGKLVLIYPEGTITRDPDGWPMHSRTGVARLALSGDVPVVPMVHWGTLDVYDHYRKKFRPSRRKEVVVRCGDPIDLSAYRGRPIDAPLLREVTDHLMGEVRTLLSEVRGEPAPSGSTGAVARLRGRSMVRSRGKRLRELVGAPGRGAGGRIVGNHVRQGRRRRRTGGDDLGPAVRGRRPDQHRARQR